MEDRKPHLPKPHKLNSEIQKAHQLKPSKLVHHFFYKAIIFTIFLLILPLLPSILPEFINPKIDSMSWELLQLIFVGIAVSYGLFSKKNEQNIDHKEHNFSLLDNANSYVSRFLHVSSVFDYEAENENPSLFDDNKIQTWSSQYYREKPIVMVAKESIDLDEQIATSSRINEKPLLFPVRSLKSLVSESNSRKSANRGVMRRSPHQMEENLEERTVYPSPIPWKSRSGRMEMKIDDSNPLFSSSQEPRSKSKSGLSMKSDFLEMDLKNSDQNVSVELSQSQFRKTNSVSELQARAQAEFPLQRKSVRTIRPKLKDLEDNVIKDQLMQEKGNLIGLVVKATETSASNHVSILHTAVKKTRLMQEKRVEKRGLMDQLMQQRLPDFKKESLMDEFNVENNDASESGSDEKHFEGRSESSKEKVENENANMDEGPDVDKADEFIAKFREQIRLQRIESIRRSTNQHSRNHSR